VPPPRPVAEVFWSLHRFLYRRSGRVGKRFGGMTTLLLITRGRKSGKERRTPLQYVEDGGRLAVVAANLGSDRPPAWWLNLQAEPKAGIRIGEDEHAVAGRAATPGEESELWPRFLEISPDYDRYKADLSREIPVVLLEPV
jgi:deazaflavin-dependent oxidoreductase (nitroreductase family)